MKLIDRISLHKLLTTIFSFILAFMRIICAKANDTTKPDGRKKILPWKKNNE